MPSSAEYQDAIRILKDAAKDEAALMACSGRTDASDAYTIALRWLRVGAAMEAGTLESIRRNRDETFDAEFRHATGYNNAFAAPDPLTAAERAMGVGT